MTLKTLKPKASNLLTLDDEFIQYCKLNNIEDIEKLARETFNRGFTILKYGEKPITGPIIDEIKTNMIEKRVITQEVLKELLTVENNERSRVENTKQEKKDIYGE